MARFKSIFAVLTCAGMTLAQPSAAQGVQRSYAEQGPSAFAGVNLTIPLGSRDRSRPSLRLQLAARDTAQEGSIPSMNFQARGLEVGFGDTGKPALFVNGRSAAEVHDRLGVGGSSGQTVLIEGGILLAVVVLAVAAGSVPGDAIAFVEEQSVTNFRTLSSAPERL